MLSSVCNAAPARMNAPRMSAIVLCLCLIAAASGDVHAAPVQPQPSPTPSLSRVVEPARTTPAASPSSSHASAAAPSTPAPTRTLSLEQGLELGLKSNTAMRMSGERRIEASAIARQAQAPLLPRLSLGATESNQTINLASLGMGSFPGIPVTSVGPFFSFDSRVRLAHTLLGNADVWRARHGRGGVVLAELQERLVTQQVATTVELLYLDLLRSRRVIDDAIANLELARSLLKLAQDQKTAGVGTGLDVTRADTQVAQDEVNLAQAQRVTDEAQFRLLHAIGLPLDVTLVLTAPLADELHPLPSLEASVEEARRQRVELLVGRQIVALYEMQIRAAQAEHQPVVSLQADYGLAGSGPVHSQGVHNVAIVMSVPIFDGGLTSARVAQARSQKRQAEVQLQESMVQVEQDVRSAVLAMRTATVQVEASRRTLELALKQLKMARNRFRTGLGDNVEVLTAQTAVENARNLQVAALSQYHQARMNLAAATGAADKFRW